MGTASAWARGWLLQAMQTTMRAWPESIPGKNRIGGWLLHRLAPVGGGQIVGAYGLRYQVPSYREPIALDLFNSGFYEPLTVSTILNHLPKDGVFLDIGANIGAISLPVAAHRPDATIVAVEADAEICRLLQANVDQNRLGKVIVCETLVGDSTEDAVAFFPAPGDKFGMGSIGPQFSANAVRLPQTTISDLLVSLGVLKVDVMKLDIEGAEFKALQGAREVLCSAHPPVVIFEFMDWAEARIAGQAAGDAQRLLMDLGYRLEVLGEDGSCLQAPLVAGGAMLVGRKPIEH